MLEERVRSSDLVAVGILQADVDDMGAAAHLRAADFGRLLELALADQPLEFAAAQHVGALADDCRARGLVNHQRFDSGDRRAQRRRGNPRAAPVHHLREQANMLGRGSAASADHVEPSLFDEPLDFGGENFRRFVVMPLFVGQSGVRHAGDREAADFRQRAQMIGHEVGTGGAIQPHPEQIPMGQRDVERLDILAGQQGAHGFDGPLHGHPDRDSASAPSPARSQSGRLWR